MTLQELRDLFRLRTMDMEKPYAWSDDEIAGYANEAVDEACRRASLIVDSSSVAASSDAGAGDVSVDLHESVIYVRRARLLGGGNLAPVVSRTMDERVPGWEDSAASTPMVFVPDWETGKLRLWPPAATACTVQMTVVRTPLSEMSDDGDVPEIPARYHRSLLDYMLHQAYLKADTDKFNPEDAQRAEARFSEEFGPPSAAIDEHWALEQYYDVGAR